MANLFSDEELGLQTASNNEGPVICLGLTFENDENRRAYFREELRKKLPELKQLEGFPIGEDDDIIALSDPPYYTACPNPWLNDFVNEWEKEKEQLIAVGKREHNKEVTEPYASDVSEGKNNPLYMAHRYHTKVPHPAIMRYILHYTEPGDIIFDGFAGTGMTGVAANLCGSSRDVQELGESNVKIGVRHAICSDLAPIATLISASYNLKFDSIYFERKSKEILEKVEREFGWMFETKVNGQTAKINYVIYSDIFVCPNCGQEINLWEESVDLKNEHIHSEFPCPHCGFTCSKKNLEKAWETSYDSILGSSIKMVKKVPVRVNYTLGKKRGEKNVDENDILVINKIDYLAKEYPVLRMPEGDESRRNDRDGITHLHHFYTKRTWIILNDVLNKIIESNLPITWLTSILQNASKMYMFRLDRKGGFISGTLFIPSLFIENNPIKLLCGKIKDVISMDYTCKGNSIVSLNSATQLVNIANDVCDYIFIDPPFGANIMYSELSSLWEGWLRLYTNNKEEAIVNHVQGKNLFDYQRLMNSSFKEFYRILKPGKWITIEFSNTSASVWNSIQNALQGVGFVVVNVAALDKKQGSFKAITTTTAVKQDLVITCYKPTDELVQKFEQTTDTAVHTWDFIEELLKHLPVHVMREMKTTAVVERSPKILYDRLISYYVQHGYAIPMNAQEFQRGLRERFVERDGMFFTTEQVLKYEDAKAKSDGVVPLGLFISSEAEGIQWLKNKLQYGPKTYQQLQPDWMQDMVAGKKGDIIPELLTILEDNFIKDDDGAWHLPNPEKEADLEIMRNKHLQKEFNLYVEQASKPRVKLKEVRLEALRYGFKECYRSKDFQTIVLVASRIPEALVMEDEVLLQYYDIAASRVN